MNYFKLGYENAYTTDPDWAMTDKQQKALDNGKEARFSDDTQNITRAIA